MLFKRLKAFLRDNHTRPMQKLKKLLQTELEGWMMKGEGEQNDDMMIVGVRLEVEDAVTVASKMDAATLNVG